MKNDNAFTHYHNELNRQAKKANSELEPLDIKKSQRMRAEIKDLIKEKVSATRRSFLDMATKAGISSAMLKASPLVAGALASQHANAQGGAKRAIYCYLPGGSIPGTWMPTGPSSMGRVTKPFEDVADVCHFREVNVELSGHASSTQAMGAPFNGANTIDSDIADVLSATTPYKSIYCASEFRGKTVEGGQFFSSAGTPFHDPYDAVKALFDSALPTGQTVPFQEAFDTQLKAIESIKNKLPLADRARLDAHASAVQDLIRRFESQQAQAGDDLVKPVLPNQDSLYEAFTDNGTAGDEQSNMAEHPLAQADVVIAALAAGLTNVGIIQMVHHSSEIKVSYEDNTVSGTYHNGTQHSDSGGGTAFARMHAYLNDVPAHIIRKLKTTNGPEGEPLINSTAFIQVSCMGSIDHTPGNSPFLLATNLPGFKSGFSNDNLNNNVTAKQIHATIAQGLGLPSSVYSNYYSNGAAHDTSAAKLLS